MRVTRTEFASPTQNHENLSEIQINLSERKFSQKKVCLVPQKWKESKICMGATRQNLQV
jgi:hypothetical protein